jgi:hypothetical protein
VTYPPSYACMDPMNRAESYAAARCTLCGCPSDLKRVGMEFTCRVSHRFLDWDYELDVMVERAEPRLVGAA